LVEGIMTNISLGQNNLTSRNFYPARARKTERVFLRLDFLPHAWNGGFQLAVATAQRKVGVNRLERILRIESVGVRPKVQGLELKVFSLKP
jgi:hypothetical protein